MHINEQDVNQLRILEESLWRAETRFDIDYMKSILMPDFFEFGRSGRIYTRQETLEIKAQDIHAKLPLKNFQAHWIDCNTTLTTYISEITDDELEIGNRSSIWVKTETGWRLRFHQGTKATH